MKQNAVCSSKYLGSPYTPNRARKGISFHSPILSLAALNRILNSALPKDELSSRHWKFNLKNPSALVSELQHAVNISVLNAATISPSKAEYQAYHNAANKCCELFDAARTSDDRHSVVFNVKRSSMPDDLTAFFLEAGFNEQLVQQARSISSDYQMIIYLMK